MTATQKRNAQRRRAKAQGTRSQRDQELIDAVSAPRESEPARTSAEGANATKSASPAANGPPKDPGGMVWKAEAHSGAS
ncbi:hypothetical protein ACLMJK_007633 [Lecanora helva]